MIARKYREDITTMLFSKPRHIRALVRKDLGVLVSLTMCTTEKGEVIKQIKEKYKEEYRVLNDYVEEPKAINHRNTIFVISKKPTLDVEPIFDRIYICFGTPK